MASAAAIVSSGGINFNGTPHCHQGSTALGPSTGDPFDGAGEGWSVLTVICSNDGPRARDISG